MWSQQLRRFNGNRFSNSDTTARLQSLHKYNQPGMFEVFVVKLRMVKILKYPQLLLLLISSGMIAVGYFGVLAAGYLDNRFPEPYHNLNFFGYFDWLAIICYFFVFTGFLLLSISSIWAVISIAHHAVKRLQSIKPAPKG